MSGNFVLSNRQNADYKIIKFNGMNKLGLFLAKNTTHILGLYFLGWAIWACLHWASLCLVQKLVMGLFFLLVATNTKRRTRNDSLE